MIRNREIKSEGRTVRNWSQALKWAGWIPKSESGRQGRIQVSRLRSSPDRVRKVFAMTLQTLLQICKAMRLCSRTTWNSEAFWAVLNLNTSDTNCVCGIFPHRQSIPHLSGHQLGVLQPSSIWTPGTYLVPNSTGVKFQSHKAALTSQASCKSQTVTCSSG